MNNIALFLNSNVQTRIPVHIFFYHVFQVEFDHIVKTHLFLQSPSIVTAWRWLPEYTSWVRIIINAHTFRKYLPLEMLTDVIGRSELFVYSFKALVVR